MWMSNDQLIENTAIMLEKISRISAEIRYILLYITPINSYY